MQSFEVTILGSSSATPTSTRNPSAQLLNMAERFFLIDCGEATQIQLRKFKVKFQRIHHIFISHLHGDHYLGLMGLLSSMHLLGRTNDLHLYAPPGLQEIIEVQFKHSNTSLNFKLVYHVLEEKEGVLIHEDEKVEVHTIPLNHRVPCYGFLFKEKDLPRKILKEKIEEYGIPNALINGIKEGNDFTTEEGAVIPNQELTEDPAAPRTYAYCSDTCYDESILSLIQGADLLYHEATFLEDKKARAKETYHSTAQEAATMAQKAGVKKLLLGHFSARYRNLEDFLTESRPVFPETQLAIEGEKHEV